MRDKKATGGDDVSGEVLNFLGEDGRKLLTQVVNNICETEEWPKDFTDFTIIALKKRPKATKCSDHHTISLIAHTANRVASIR
jgi:hypothetical protein